MTGVEMNDALTEIFLTSDVYAWQDAILALEIPNYYIRHAYSTRFFHAIRPAIVQYFLS